MWRRIVCQGNLGDKIWVMPEITGSVWMTSGHFIIFLVGLSSCKSHLRRNLLLRQLKMLISGGIGNFRMLEVIANLRRSFNERFHKGTGFRFQVFVIADRFS